MLEGQTGVYVPTNIHAPLAEGNFRDESDNTVKPLVTEDYNTHMGLVKSVQMSTSYGKSAEPGSRQNSSSTSDLVTVSALISTGLMAEQ
jgi:hypothetical protein